MIILVMLFIVVVLEGRRKGTGTLRLLAGPAGERSVRNNVARLVLTVA